MLANGARNGALSGFECIRWAKTSDERQERKARERKELAERIKLIEESNKMERN